MKTKVACIQLKAFDVAGAEAGLENALRMVDEACKENPELDLAVLPEIAFPAYYLGDVEDFKAFAALCTDALEKFREKAREQKIFIAVGLPESANNKLYNTGFLIDRAGNIAGSTRKSFLWHFDSDWYSSGDDLYVCETEIGKIALIVCADGRQPEISRVMAVKGAEIIVDLTNLVTSGNDPKQLSNPQYEYMIPTRAFENKVWMVVANKAGQETPALQFCGRSCMIAPTGEELISASSYKEEIIVGDLDLTMTHDKSINKNFNIISDRAPRVYQTIASEERLPILDTLKEAVYPEKTSIFASSVQFPADSSLDHYLQGAESFVKELSIQKAELILFPSLGCTCQPEHYERIILAMQQIASKYGAYLVTSAARKEEGQSYRLAVLVGPNGVIGEYKKVHLDSEEKKLFTPGQAEPPVFELPFGKVGLMMDEEGFLAEIPRILMLKGADAILWSAHFTDTRHRMVARTRAAESRIFIIAASTFGPENAGNSLIATPAGAVVASAYPDFEQAVSSQVDLGIARYKQVVPGTNVVTDRMPSMYRVLAES